MKNFILLAILTGMIYLTYLTGFSQEYVEDSSPFNKDIIHNLIFKNPGKAAFKKNNLTGVDSVDVKIIYSKGKLPVKRWVPDTLGIDIKKNIAGLFPVKIEITIQNRIDSSVIYDSSFTISQSNTFDTLISRQLPKFFQVQYDRIIVDALPGKVEEHFGNDFFFDTKQYCQDITIDRYNYADPCLSDDGGVGFDGVSGNFVAAFNNYDTTNFILNSVDYCFFDTLGGGNHPYKIVVYADDGAGKPGLLLYISPLLFTPPGTGLPQNVTHILTVPLSIAANSRFHVGYKQISTANIAACFQNEIPIRKRSFFFSSPETSSIWTDFSSAGANFRLDISPNSGNGKINVTVLPQALYNSVSNKLNIKDTVRVYLRQASLPYSLVDSAKGVIDSVTLSNNYSFSNSYTGNYYLVARHRNCIETWSKNPVSYISGSQIFYDYSTSALNAYGNNEIQVDNVPVRFAIFSGDVNQDGRVNLTDIILIYNDVISFVVGYKPTDLNGDYITNLNDLVICYNNALNFVAKITP